MHDETKHSVEAGGALIDSCAFMIMKFYYDVVESVKVIFSCEDQLKTSMVTFISNALKYMIRYRKNSIIIICTVQNIYYVKTNQSS